MEPEGVGSTLMAVDPGESSGIAVFVDGEYDHAFTVASDKGLRRLKKTMESAAGTLDIVVEVMPPTRHNQRAGEQVIRLVVDSTPLGHLRTCMPSAWKGHPRAIAEKGEGNDRHQRDAIKMGRWALATQTTLKRSLQ